MKDKNPLFEDMVKKLDDDKELYGMMYAMLFGGKSIPCNPNQRAISIGAMLGFVKDGGGSGGSG